MPKSDPVLLTSLYHPKTGSEKNFVKSWSELIGGLAYQMGADQAALYYNEDNDEYLASIHWPMENAAQKFLHSPEFREATLELNTICMIPSAWEQFEVLHEKAA